VVEVRHLLVTATECRREIDILWKTITDIGIATRIHDVHCSFKAGVNLPIRPMVRLGEHVAVDGLVLEVMQHSIYL
jgi:hypothetical protein